MGTRVPEELRARVRQAHSQSDPKNTGLRQGEGAYATIPGRETTTENEDGETVVSPPTGLGFDRIIPAHYDAPVRAGPDDLRRAFAFLDAGSFADGLAAAGAELPEEDMGTLLKVNDVLERIGLGKGTE